MAYDVVLADRIREALSMRRDVTERRMFGGVAFLVAGHMAVCAGSEGRMMVRLAREEVNAALEEPGTDAMTMSGRAIRGWITVQPGTLAADDDLGRWIDRGVAYCETLPPK